MNRTRSLAPIAPLPWSMRVPAALLVAATLWFGLDTSLTVVPAQQAAAALLGVAR